MSANYKLCPKCNNALDNDVMQCPYCGEKIGIDFWMDDGGFHGKIGSSRNKKSGGCGCLFFIFIFVSFILPLMGKIFSLIVDTIVSFFG